MESHKELIPCERCENSSKLHQIKTYLMTPLVIRCRNTCVLEICVCFFSPQNVECRNVEFFLFMFYWINHKVFISFISLFKIVFDYIM